MGHMIQVMTFRTSATDHDLLRRHASSIGLAVSEFPGYVDGHCLTDLSCGLVGGVMVWESEIDLERFRHSELYARLMLSPTLDNGIDRAFDSTELDGGDILSQAHLAAA